jgi:hypothetical protein
MNQQQKTPFTSLLENYAFAKWLTRLPALTIMVILRRDMGYRLLNVGVLTAVFGLLFVVTVLATPGNEAANTTPLLIFAAVGYFNGIAQKIRRWRDMNRGIVIHSYYLGSSPFEFKWLPDFMRRNRRVARFGDPIIAAIIGLALFPFSHALSLWVTFSAFCLRAYEHQIFQRELARGFDFGDSIIEAEIVIEQQNPAPTSSQNQETSGIPSGLGNDIKSKIRSK